MARRVYKDVPLADITLRKFEKPPRDLDTCIRRFCMSVGLLQPGDSRDIISDILKLFIKARNRKKLLSSDIITENLKSKYGATKPNVRRHIRRLRELGIVEKFNTGYRIKEFMDFRNIMLTHFKPFLLDTTFERIMDYSKTLDELSDSI
jgi:DNA-binding transcriptional ArsR family regulator